MRRWPDLPAAVPAAGAGVDAKAQPPVSESSPRQRFRVLTQTRGGYGGTPLHDVHIQAASSGELLQAHSFHDAQAAADFKAQVEADLDALAEPAFRRKYGLPAEA